jgi:hypothetical protein
MPSRWRMSASIYKPPVPPGPTGHADIPRHQDLENKAGGHETPVGGIHSIGLAGQAAQTYTTRGLAILSRRS